MQQDLRDSLETMFSSNIAIVGGGKFCRSLLQLFFEDFSTQRPFILGVADPNPYAEGVKYAKDRRIFTTQDYKELYQLEDLDLIVELTKDNSLMEMIEKTKPPMVRFIDHFKAINIWVALQIEVEKKHVLYQLEGEKQNTQRFKDLFELYADRVENIVNERTDFSQKIARELMESERTMSQIIQGSTIPTFVINKDHVITHWNKALENLSGYFVQDMVGTKNQSIPFWKKERPTMADIILYQYEEGELFKYYGEKWRKSTLIEGSYEAEVFFPSLGENGKWCFFTAAPIKSPDGTIIGAIETLWDKTEEKKAEEERENYTRDLATLCSIYTAMGTSKGLDERIYKAIQEIKDFLYSDNVGIYLLESGGKFYLRYSIGASEIFDKYVMVDNDSLISQIAKREKVTIYQDLENDNPFDKRKAFVGQKIRSLIFVPISAKGRGVFGIIMIGLKVPSSFTKEKENILELIGNRIGVAIEKARLQEQYIKSEEKYRSLFNNDPNPIFIIDNQTYEILDFNQRAQDYYGYSREELLAMTFWDLSNEKDKELVDGLKNLEPNQSVLYSKKRHYRKNRVPFYVNINVSHAQYGDKDVLIATTTDITESVEKEAQLVQASKMTTLGTMVAGMAHEISQPLNVLQVCADYFMKMLKKKMEIGQEEMRSIAVDIIDNVKRATGIIKHMKDFARQSDVVKSKVNINDPIKDVFKILGNQLKIHGVQIELDLNTDPIYIMGEHNRLEQVFVNLVTNALDAMDAKTSEPGYENSDKRLTVRSFTVDNQAVVTVSDTGTGMSTDDMEKIFEPFFTTKEVGKGTGLGVSISYGIVKDFDGTIEVDSQLGEGTVFELRFPTSYCGISGKWK